MRLPGFVGPSNEEQSYTASQERTVNLYPHLTNGRPVLYNTPGVELIASTTTTGGRAHFWDASSGREFAVYGGSFIEISEGGTFTDHGSVALNDNPATISSNGDGGGEIFITSGGNGYIFTLSTDTLSTVAALNGKADQGDHIDGYFLALEFSSSTVYFSDLLDGTTWTTGTNFFQRSASADAWVAMKVLSGDLIWLWGEKSSEVWFNAGTFPLPFAPHPSGRGIEYGCDAAFSPATVEGSMAWLGSSANGTGMVLRTAGFEVSRVSTAAVEFAVEGYAQAAQAIGDAYSEAGHVFYLAHVPGGVTWCYDHTVGAWHERMTWISEENVERTLRWRHHAYAFGEHRWLDTDTGSVYRSGLEFYTDVDSRPIRRIRRPPTVSDENKRIFFRSIEVLCDVGTGLVGKTVLTTPGEGTGLDDSLFDGASFWAYYEFEGDGADENGGASDLTEVNSPVYVLGVKDQGAQLTKVTDLSDSPHYVLDGASAGSFNPGSSSFSLLAWFRVATDAPAVILPIFSKGADPADPPAPEGWILYYINGVIIAIIGGSSSQPQVASSGGFSQGEWHLAALTVDRVADVATLYVDGASPGLMSTTSVSGMGTVTTSQDLVAGGVDSDSGSGRAFDGSVDQFAFAVGKVWTPEQIQNVFNTQTVQGADPQIMMRYSDDGGKNWSGELWKSAGEVGEYDTRVRWERLGMARRRVFEFVMTDPVPWRLVDAFVEMRPQRP